jgi:hypothetical protein
LGSRDFFNVVDQQIFNPKIAGFDQQRFYNVA